jgi:hypothetical protein
MAKALGFSSVVWGLYTRLPQQKAPAKPVKSKVLNAYIF